MNGYSSGLQDQQNFSTHRNIAKIQRILTRYISAPLLEEPITTPIERGSAGGTERANKVNDESL